MQNVDVVIIGAGAAGLMCAIETGKRGRSVLVLEHANKPGKKILMSGGGRCNFTNLHAAPQNYLSHNKHFCKSALSRYRPEDFIKLVRKHHIDYHEKTLGQLFCDHQSKDILNMLLMECEDAHVDIRLNTTVTKVEKKENGLFFLKTSEGEYGSQSLVIATGGLSIPTMGATPFGYQIAAQFGLKVWPTRAGLVPFTLQPADKEKLSLLSGISVDSIVSTGSQQFAENILFTHRGLSGPAILQISSYWEPGESIVINLLPKVNLLEAFKLAHSETPNKHLKTWMGEYLPKRVVEVFLNETDADRPLQGFSLKKMAEIVKIFSAWTLKPSGTEGYRTAEVTLGGVDCDMLSSKTLECNDIPGLYFIGEVVDVTGWLGGFNFQWAWSSGWAAGQVV